MKKLTFDELPLGGFAGLTEKRFVTDRRVFNAGNSKAFDGLGNFVYLADANFQPHGETRMHPHREIDVISVMVAGKISHQGSLEHGQSLDTGYTQVQRAGAEGFSHNEINPDDKENQLIQLWVLPDEHGESAGYKVYPPSHGKLTKIYGGNKQQQATFYSKTALAVGQFSQGETASQSGEVMAYLTKGSAIINSEKINARTLIHSDNGIEFTAENDAQLIVIYHET